MKAVAQTATTSHNIFRPAEPTAATGHLWLRTGEINAVKGHIVVLEQENQLRIFCLRTGAETITK
jgi:hypothetical protein